MQVVFPVDRGRSLRNHNGSTRTALLFVAEFLGQEFIFLPESSALCVAPFSM
jgi:hypothetical protein